jgi:rhodanese-related sulfurtransferase
MLHDAVYLARDNQSTIAPFLQYGLQPASQPFRFAFMEHSPGFLKFVNEVRPRVHEITLEQARERLRLNPRAALIDVREDREWDAGHATEARHLGKGIFERDLEKAVPDPETEIILYCGGGFRSALAADAAQRMGYRNVFSLIGGYKAMLAENWPMTKP